MTQLSLFGLSFGYRITVNGKIIFESAYFDDAKAFQDKIQRELNNAFEDKLKQSVFDLDNYDYMPDQTMVYLDYHQENDYMMTWFDNVKSMESAGFDERDF